MTKAARFAAFFIAIVACPAEWLFTFVRLVRHWRAAAVSLFAAAVFLSPHYLAAQADCLACHGDKSMQDATGHSIAVNGDKFSASIHAACNATTATPTSRNIPTPTTSPKSTANPATPTKPRSSPAACIHPRKSIPAQAVMAMLTKSSPKRMHARRSIH